MVMCWVPGCNHYNVREKCKFFTFPKHETAEYKKWIKLIRRVGEPTSSARVCSCHFKDGIKENLPEIFDRNITKHFGQHHLSPEKKKRRGTHETRAESSIVSRDLSSELVAEPAISQGEHFAKPSTSKYIDAPSSIVVEAENYYLRQTVEDLKQKKIGVPFSYEEICHDNKLVLLYTGLPDAKLFEMLFNLCDDVEIQYYHARVLKIQKCDQLLITLMKLRLNSPHKDLACRFHCAESVISNIFITWLHVLHSILYVEYMSNIPSTLKNQSCLPSTFNTFSNCRIILDCTEVYTSTSRRSMLIQKATFSSYKQRNTWKGLVGVAPNGVITFLSELYAGGTSDKKIVQDCGILNQLVAGDLVLADKGFLIQDILPPGVSLNIPPFLTTDQFTEEQVRRTESIARARVHVERAIRRMKCYNILNFIPESLIPEASTVFQVVGALTNLQFPLIKEVEQYFNLND